MHKKLRHTLEVVLLALFLAACSSPEEKAADYIQNAAQLFEEGQLHKAELEFKNALQINQNLPEAWFGLARIHEKKQEWRKAYAVLTKLRELAPSHTEGRIMLGQILLASNQIDQALTDAREIIELAPGDARAHALMAAVQFRLENFKGAHAEVDKALAADPGNDEAILVRARVLIAEKKYDAALRILDKAIAANPDHISMYLMKIQVYQETNNQGAIEKAYMGLTKLFPENVSFKTALARYYLAARDIDAAEKVLEDIVQAEPTNVAEKLRLVGFKNQFRSPDDAIALVKTYIDLDKNELRYQFLLAELFEKNGKPEQAINIYRQIIKVDELKTNGLEARNKIALLQLRAGKRDEAKALVNEVLAQDKGNENALLLQTGFQLAEKRYDDALLSARTVLRDKPDSIKALGLLGQAYEAMGSGELALESYKKAFQLSPGAAPIANQLAKSLLRKRDFTKVDEILLESISRGNRSTEALWLLAQVKLLLGEWDKAEQLAKQLQQIEGQQAVSQQVLGAVYQGKQDQEASIEAFKRAHELAPTATQPVVALVRTYVRSGKIGKAKAFLNSVLSVHEDNITAHLLLGQLKLSEKDTGGAVSHFKQAIAINPKIDAGYRGLIGAYIKDDKLEKAEQVARQGLAEMPDRPVFMIYLASIYERQKDFEKAIETYESLLAKSSNVLVAKNNLASLLTDHRKDQASFDRARNLSADLRTSQIPQFRDTYAWAAVKSGINLEEAIVILQGIVKENEHVDIYNYHLGEAYRKRGDKENAIAYLTKAAKQAGPGSDIAAMANQSIRQLN
jgi:tetratricopeptide (TPR) repeat protein